MVVTLVQRITHCPTRMVAGRSTRAHVVTAHNAWAHVGPIHPGATLLESGRDLFSFARCDNQATTLGTNLHSYQGDPTWLVGGASMGVSTLWAGADLVHAPWVGCGPEWPPQEFDFSHLPLAA